jgi:hypothetical protein
MRLDTLTINENAMLGDLKLPELPVDLLRSIGVDISPSRQTTNKIPARQTGHGGNSLNNTPDAGSPPEADDSGGETALFELPDYNPLLD